MRGRRGRRGITAVALLPVVLACASAQAGSQSGPSAPRPAPTEFLYVTNQDGASISVIDLGTLTVDTTLDLTKMGFGPNASPHHVEVEPDGSHWYVSLIGAHRVLKFDQANRVVGSVEFETPGMVHLHPDGATAWVARSMTAPNPPMRIGVIDRRAMTIEEVGVFFPRPHALAISPDGRFVFTASMAENQMMTVEVETGDVTFTAVEGPIHVLAHFALSPDGTQLAVSGERTAKVLIFDVTAAPELRLLHEIDVPAAPWNPAFTPDGRFLYVPNHRADAVTVIRVSDWTVDTIIRGAGLANPYGAAASPDGRYVYVSNRNLDGQYNPGRGANPPGTVVVINTATNAIEKVIEVGRGATGVGLRGGHHGGHH
jgi:DNA-binding beta-propeller fold protein YncE